MLVSTPREEYVNQLPAWELMQDALDGEPAIKSKGVGYLLKPDGLVSEESSATGFNAAETKARYDSYRQRAEYPLWVKDSLRTMMGMVSRLEPEIVLPERMATLLDNATSDGFGLQQLFMRICSDLLTKGRKPILADFDAAGKPYVATYTAEAAINWRATMLGGRQDLTMVVLSEQREKADNNEFQHDTETVYRVLDISEGRYRVRLMDESGNVLEESRPGIEGGGQLTPLGYIPLVFAGSTDNNVDIDEIPLMSMAKAALKYYTLSADLYQNAHNASHTQPVVTGISQEEVFSVTGPNLAWVLPEGANAYYLESTGQGCAINERLMEKQRNSALEAGARVIDTGGTESGEARKARQSDQHSSLHSVVMQGAEAVEQCLRYIAEWMSLNPDEVIFSVEPKFSPEEVDAAMMAIVRDLRLAGEVPVEVLFEALRKARVTSLSNAEFRQLLDGQAIDGD